MRTVTKQEIFALLPRRRADANKGEFGTVAAVAGSMAYRGAAAPFLHAPLRSAASPQGAAAPRSGLLPATAPTSPYFPCLASVQRRCHPPQLPCYVADPIL